MADVARRHKWLHMDEGERRKWQDPEAILTAAGIRTGVTFLDVGCGTGFFTLSAARLAGPSGTVYALDIDAEAIEILGRTAEKERLTNIRTVVGAAEDTLLCQGCADLVFFGIVLHDFGDPARVLANARKMVKGEGKLANVDWKKEPSPVGPPLAIRFRPEYASALIERAGFAVERVEDCGPHHYLIVARPAAGPAPAPG